MMIFGNPLLHSLSLSSKPQLIVQNKIFLPTIPTFLCGKNDKLKPSFSFTDCFQTLLQYLLKTYVNVIISIPTEIIRKTDLMFSRRKEC